MNLWQNPIFLTQRRLAHRAGVVAPMAITLLTGLSLLAALGYNLAQRPPWSKSEEVGRVFFAWLLVLQALILVVGSFSRISRTIVEERKAGLLDSNRLTPLSPQQLGMGYWLGSAARECYAAATLVPIGLAMVLMANLPLTLWLGTQVLLLTTALVFGLLAVLAGMALPRPEGGVGALAVVLFVGPATAAATRFSLFNFLLPTYATVHLFNLMGGDWVEWEAAAGLFGLHIPPFLYTLGVQFLFGMLLWLAVVRKFTNPFRPALARWQSLTVFALVLLLQHGLLWDRWHGVLPAREVVELGLVQAATLALGCIILGGRCLWPEQARRQALRSESGVERWTFTHSGPFTAVLLAALGSAGLLTHCAANFGAAWLRFGLAAANLFAVFLSFSLLLELCRLTSRKRSLGYFVLGLVVLYALPFLLSFVFWSAAPLHFSFLSPSVLAMAYSQAAELRPLTYATVMHGIVVLTLAWFWFMRWRQWLRRAAALAGAAARPVA